MLDSLLTRMVLNLYQSPDYPKQALARRLRLRLIPKHQAGQGGLRRSSRDLWHVPGCRRPSIQRHSAEQKM